jgi:hypothetical protein
LFPAQQREAAIALRIKYIDFVEKKLTEASHAEETPILEIPWTFWNELRKQPFPQAVQNRVLISHWKDRAKIREKWDLIKGTKGVGGGASAQGVYAPMNMLKNRQTIRVSDKFRKSVLHPLSPLIKEWSEKQRS